MGFFSYNCRGCGHPLLHNSFSPTNAWMIEGVAITEEGSILQGTYDGYGHLSGLGILDQGEKPDVYHKACWDVLGRPMEYKGGSKDARDQGYFFSAKAHDMARPMFRSDLPQPKVKKPKAPKTPIECECGREAHLCLMHDNPEAGIHGDIK
jgi:hypothetical protein